METNRNAKQYYIASCVFATKYPELSMLIQKYMRDRHDIAIVRCCVPRYRLQEFEEQMPIGGCRETWRELPDCGDYRPGDTVYSLCHNCSAIIEETRPGVNVKSLWEIIDTDEKFIFPDYRQHTIALQDCWRAKGRSAEQETVRHLLRKMNLIIMELPDNRDQSDFCGISLLRPAPPRNLKLAPKRFVKQAVGKFLPHTPEQQVAAMRAHSRCIPSDAVVAYCHYCVEGLNLGSIPAFHLAQLLFQSETMQVKLGGK